MASSSPPTGEDLPSGFSILKDSIRDLNQQIYAEVAKLIPSISEDTTDDDDSGTDVDIVFSGYGAAPSEQQPAPPLASPYGTTVEDAFRTSPQKRSVSPPPSTACISTGGQPGKQSQAQASGKPSDEANLDDVILSVPESTRTVPSEMERKHILQALGEAGTEKDGPLLAGLLSMQGWLSGAAGRLAQGNMTRRQGDGDEESTLLSEALPSGEAEQQRDQAAADEAEGSFHAVVSRSDYDIVAEEVEAAGLRDMPTMNLEESISGMDLDGLLARLKRDGDGAPATGDQALVQLEWNLPPPESLFYSSDEEKAEDTVASSQGSENRKATAVDSNGDVVPVQSKAPRSEVDRPHRGRAIRGRGGRGSRGGRAGGRAVLERPERPKHSDGELGAPIEHTAPATVVLDLRQQSSGGAGPGKLPTTHNQGRAPAESSSASSSSDEDDLEDFYSSRRQQIEPHGVSASGESRPARPTGRGGMGGRSRPRVGRGARHGGRLWSREEPKSEPSHDVNGGLSLPTTQRGAKTASSSSSHSESDSSGTVPFLRPTAAAVVVADPHQEQAHAQEREQQEAEEEERREEVRKQQQIIAELKAAALAEEREATQLSAKRVREAERARQREAERQRQEEEARQRAKVQAAQDQLHRSRRTEWLQAATQACPAGSIPLTDVAITFTNPLPQLPPHFHIKPDRLVTVAVSLSEDPLCLPAVLDWALSQQAPSTGPAFAVVSALLVPEWPINLAGWTLCTKCQPAADRSRALCLAVDASPSNDPPAFLAALSQSLKHAEFSSGHLRGRQVLARTGAHGLNQPAKLHTHPLRELDTTSESAIALLNKDVLSSVAQLSAASRMMAEHGLHLAGLKILYLSAEQATELGHRSRHHPPALIPLAAFLVHGADAVSRIQTLLGPADPLLAMSAEPESLHARLASCLPEPPGPHCPPLATVSKDTSAGLFEMKLMFGGRLPLHHMDSPPRGWQPDPAWLAHVHPAPPQEAWLLSPAETDADVAVAMQVLEHIGRKGFRLVSLRRMGLPAEAMEHLRGALGRPGVPPGKAEPPLPAAGRPVLVACVSGDGAARLASVALSSVSPSSFPGLLVTQGPREAAQANEALRKSVELPPGGAWLAALRSGSACFDPSGRPEEGEEEGGRQVALVAFRASHFWQVGSALGELLGAPGASQSRKHSLPEALPSLQLLAVRRVAALKEVAIPWFWVGHSPSARQRSQALHQPVVLALVSGLEASAHLRGLLAQPTPAGAARRMSALQQCMLAVCPGRVAAQVVAQAYFSEQDLSASQIIPNHRSPSSFATESPKGAACQSCEELLPVVFSAPQLEDTLLVIDGEALSHGILSRVMRLASKHGFSLSGMEMVRIGAAEELSLGIAQNHWRWQSTSATEAAVLLKLRKVNAVRNCVTMLADCSGLLEARLAPEALAAGAAASGGDQVWAVGKGLLALAGGEFPVLPGQWFNLDLPNHPTATTHVVRPPSGLEQTTCLTVGAPLSLDQDSAGEGPTLADLADALDCLIDNGFQVSGLRLTESLMVQTSSRRPSLAAPAGSRPGSALVLALSRDNGIGKLQILMQEARRVSRDRRGSLLAVKPQARISETMALAEKQLIHYFESLHMTSTAIQKQQAPQPDFDLSEID